MLRSITRASLLPYLTHHFLKSTTGASRRRCRSRLRHRFHELMKCRWYWGPDYPPEQKAGVNKTVFHSARGRFEYKTPKELRDQINSTVLEELATAGKIVDRFKVDIPPTCWETKEVRASWSELDTTTLSSLGPAMRSQDARQVH